jgi:hypothetical protein
MTLTDQQLRQELISYGETVPPITQRNREQFRARLEVLQSRVRTRTRTPASPSRPHAPASPSRSHVTASPSRTRTATASPSRASPAAASPSRTTRATASPSRLIATSSPSRARSSTTTTAVRSRPKTRSQQAVDLVELSDSETDATSTGVLTSRSTHAGQTTPNIQTRSIALRRQQESPTSLSATSDLGGPAPVFADIEQSIARHRREIKQLLDSARDRNRVTATESPSINSAQQSEPPGTPIHPSSKSRSHRQSLKSDDDDDKATKQSPTSVKEGKKKVCSARCMGKSILSLWGKYENFIKTLFKIILIMSVFLGGVILISKNAEVFLQRKEINCSVENATQCQGMVPVIAAVRKQLQIRTGEVDCNLRARSDILVTRSEIERYLNEKGIKFTLGDEERWNALVTYILIEPINDIVVWNETNHPTKNLGEAKN